MSALALGLRSLDSKTFELLIVSLLKARYPDIDIKHVDGQSGDQGLDIISGYLDEYPTIWQCKSFTSGNKASHKQQIKDSLNSALCHCNPRRWVLCLSTDLDADVQRWWQQLTKSNRNRTELELWQATDIIQQLLYQDAIREQFFPSITINVPAIREVLAGTKLLPIEDLAALNEQNANAYLARLEKLDARFSYAITHARNGKPLSSPPSGSLLTVTKDHTTLHVMPRDREALKANPPRVRFTVQGSGVEKFFEHHRTGKPVTFSPDELIGFKSDFEFLMPAELAGMSLQVTPSASQPTIPLRVTFGKGVDSFTYEYILFQRASAGTEEGTFQSSTPLPFPITVVLRKDGTGNVSFEDKCNGHDVQEAHRMAKAIIAAIESGEVEFYDLSRGTRFFRATLNGAMPDWLPKFELFLDDARAVSNDYAVPLIVPDVIKHDDHRALLFLRKLHAGFSTSVEPITLTMDKSADAQQVSLADIAHVNFQFVTPEFPEEIVVFGKRIFTGPVQYSVPNAQVRELEEYREFLLRAPIGASINLTLEPIGEIVVRRHLQPTSPTS